MTTQPNALKLADELDLCATVRVFNQRDIEQAAAELRRLHEANQELLEALEKSSEQEQPPLPVQEPVACRFCFSKKGCWAWQCYNCGEIDDVVQKPPLPVQEPVAWDKPSASFNEWWDSDRHDNANPFEKDSAAYWAWAGWKAARLKEKNT